MSSVELGLELAPPTPAVDHRAHDTLSSKNNISLGERTANTAFGGLILCRTGFWHELCTSVGWLPLLNQLDLLCLSDIFRSWGELELS